MIENDERLRDTFRSAHDPGDDRSHCPASDDLARALSEASSRDDRRAIALHLMSCSACASEFHDAAGLKHLGEVPLVVQARPLFRIALAAAAMLVLILGSWALSLLRENRQLAQELLQAQQHRTPSYDESLDELRRLREQAERQNETIAKLEQESVRPPTPSINVPVIDLDPSVVLRGESREVREISLPRGATTATLILNSRSENSFSDYSITMAASDGDLIWTSSGLIRSPYDTFTITIPKLEPGSYTLRLAGLRGGRQVPRETYAIRVR